MNEVERLFQEQQTASDRARNPEADVRSAQTIMDQHESMNAAESLFQANQPAPFAEHNTEKQTKTVQRLLNTAIFLKVIQTALVIGAYQFPGTAIAVMYPSFEFEDAAGFLTNPILLLPALLSFGMILLFYVLLSRQNRKCTEACVPLLILTLILPIMFSAVSTVENLFLMQWITRISTNDVITAYNLLRSAVSLISWITAPVIPLLSAAAGMLCSRRKYTQG